MHEHEIFRFESASTRLAFSGGELKTKESDSSCGYAVRALEGGRIGFAHCQHEGQIRDAIAKALSLSRFSVKSAFSFAPQSPFPNVAIEDPLILADDAGLLSSLVSEAREAASSKGGAPRIIAQLDSSRAAIENTAGFSGSYGRTLFSLYSECMHADGFGFSYYSSNRLPQSVAEQGRNAAEMAKAMQNASKPDSGTYTVVMELEALESIIETVMPSLSGDWKRRRISPLAGGRRRFSRMLTICEDGLAAGTSARPFDDEGTPSVRRALIEKGEVKSFLYDRETAALEGVAQSGACSRESYDTAPGIGASNIVISPGRCKDLSELGRLIEVHSAHGSHTANPTTGDIGLEVSAAFMLEGGKRRPLKGFMLSANVFDMFANIEEIEKEQRTYGSLISPRIAFRQVRAIS